MPTMPSVVGRNLEDATALLEAAGVVNPNAVGYFGIWPITAQWVKAPGPSFNVTAQSVTAGATVAVNAPIVLSVIQPPVGVSYE